MKKQLLISILIASQSLFPSWIWKVEPLALQQQQQEIHFAEPIHLFAPRNLAERIEKKYPTTPAAVIAWLKTAKSYEALQDVIGRQLPQTAHDTKRKETYTGIELNPSFIVLTNSGKSTLSETVESLKKEGLAHNFLIDKNGNIHPVSNENESIEDALKHRPYALGISGRVIDGYYEQRDMNSASITISVVGTKDVQPTSQQNQAIIALVKDLSKKYSIRPDQVLDYGCVACYPDGSYGRRDCNPNLPWTQIATYPKEEHADRTKVNFNREITETVWTALALRKIGYICPITSDPNNKNFQKALIAFQNHTQADRQYGLITYDTICKLNSMIIQHEQHNPKLKDIEPPALPLRNQNSFESLIDNCRD